MTLLHSSVGPISTRTKASWERAYFSRGLNSDLSPPRGQITSRVVGTQTGERGSCPCGLGLSGMALGEATRGPGAARPRRWNTGDARSCR